MKRSDFVKAIMKNPIKLKPAKGAIQFTSIDRKKYEISEKLKQRRHT